MTAGVNIAITGCYTLVAPPIRPGMHGVSGQGHAPYLMTSFPEMPCRVTNTSTSPVDVTSSPHPTGSNPFTVVIKTSVTGFEPFLCFDCGTIRRNSCPCNSSGGGLGGSAFQSDSANLCTKGRDSRYCRTAATAETLVATMPKINPAWYGQSPPSSNPTTAKTRPARIRTNVTTLLTK